MGHPERKYFTVEEYLDIEVSSLEKHEYYQGEIFAMAGASIEHNRIVSNVLLSKGLQTKDKSCIPYGSDLRIKVESAGLYTYPDISVICGEIKKSDDKLDCVTNPTVIIEVLSTTTKDYDRGSKFAMYRGLKSLKEYVVIDSTGSILIEKWSISKEGIWQLQEYTSKEETIDISSIEVEISVAEIYEGVYKII